MAEWCVPVSGEMLDDLTFSIDQGPVIEIVDGEGRWLLTEVSVGKINGIKVDIFSNEHPPPHFRVELQSSKANFSISDCTLLVGSGEVLRYEKNIRLWWKQHKDHLIQEWNRLRPSDCPVGVYREDGA